MSTFNPGDVVRLKSGGPKMTVRNLVGPPPHAGMPTFKDPVTCDWFGGAPEALHTKTFEEVALAVVAVEATAALSG